MQPYIPLTEASNTLDKHQIFFYLNDNGQKVGGMNHNAVKVAAGDRDTHTCFHDVFHGNLMGPSYNTQDKPKKLKEDANMSYKELLEIVSGRRNSPTIFHYSTRGIGNGADKLHQQGSFNKDVITKMAEGRPISQTPLHLYAGHLTSQYQ
jgi:hypothetical protein